MRIGPAAHAARVSIDTLRFYERRGLIVARRDGSGYRVYSGETLARLGFIREAKELGFSLREIKELLSLGVKSTRECGPVTRKAEVKLAAMNRELRRLRRLRRTLKRMIHNCGGSCAGEVPCPTCKRASAANQATG
ncbi:MAG: MerR family transcriptional regulator [Candidatus Binataceae bacterium]